MFVVNFLMNALMTALTPEKIKGFIIAGREALVAKVQATATEWDDKLLIPACDLVLAGLDIPGPDGKIDISAELAKLIGVLGEFKNVFLDAGLDYIEQAVVDSENKIDDAIVLPLTRLTRQILKVPDDDLIG